MGRGVAGQTFELERDLDHPCHGRVAGAGFRETRLHLDGLRQAHGLRRVVGHELADPVDEAEGQAQHPADVAQGGAGHQLAEGDDVGDAVVAVAVLDVADHLVAAVLAEIDVEIRHRDAVGVEEALEEQAEAQGVEIGDLERPGSDGASPGAAAGPDRDVLALGPLDEVGDDQEVARKAHLDDDVELVGEPLAVGGGGIAHDVE
jgi:hypothetical protein